MSEESHKCPLPSSPLYWADLLSGLGDIGPEESRWEYVASSRNEVISLEIRNIDFMAALLLRSLIYTDRNRQENNESFKYNPKEIKNFILKVYPDQSITDDDIRTSFRNLASGTFSVRRSVYKISELQAGAPFQRIDFISTPYSYELKEVTVIWNPWVYKILNNKAI